MNSNSPNSYQSSGDNELQLNNHSKYSTFWILNEWGKYEKKYNICFHCFKINFHFSIHYQQGMQFVISVSTETNFNTKQVLFKLAINNKLNTDNIIHDERVLLFEPKSQTNEITLPFKFCFLKKENGFVSENAEVALYLEVSEISTHENLLINNFDKNLLKRLPAPFAGLKNQGSTCYMNSILQSLFHLPKFRKLIYTCNTISNDPDEKNILLNLQRLFGIMQLSKDPVSTSDLIKSFGWTNQEVFIQNDAQEFFKILLDHIETKLKGSSFENEISNLFRGSYITLYKCKDVNFQNEIKSVFYDISLDVNNSFSLTESFERFVETESLKGENQYNTGDIYGKQDADMRILFLEFPKILQIHLRRFQFDSKKNVFAKLNSYLSFPEVIDLAPYSVDKDKTNLYELFGVLIHWGTISSGHYFAYLRTSKEKRWYMFNDSTVIEVSFEEVIKAGYGGFIRENIDVSHENHQDSQIEKKYSAYLLIYVCKAAVNEIFNPVEKSDIPKSVFDFINQKIKTEMELELERQGKNDSIDVYIYDDLVLEIFAQNDEIKLGNPNIFNRQLIIPHCKIKFYDDIPTIYKKISQLNLYKSSNFKLFIVYKGYICSMLPKENVSLFKDISPQINELYIQIDNTNISQMIKKDIENKNDNYLFNNNDGIYAFIFVYIRELKQAPIHFLFTIPIQNNDTIEQLYDCFRQYFGLANDFSLDAYYADSSHSVLPFIHSNQSLIEFIILKRAEYIIIQPKNPNDLISQKGKYIEKIKSVYNKVNFKNDQKSNIDEGRELPISYIRDFLSINPPTVFDYLQYTYQTLKVMVFNEFNYKQLLNVPCKLNLEEFKYFAGSSLFLFNNLNTQNIHYDPQTDIILLFPIDGCKQPFLHKCLNKENDNKTTIEQILNEILLPNKIVSLYLLFFKNCTLASFSDRLLIKVHNHILFNQNNINFKVIYRLVPSFFTIRDLIIDISKLFKIDLNQIPLRIVAFYENIAKVLSDEFNILNLITDIRIEEIPIDQQQQNLQPTDLFISACKFVIAKDPSIGKNFYQNDGDPFIFKLIQDEKFSKTKERIYNKPGITGTPQSTITFYLCDPHCESNNHILTDEDILTNLVRRDCYLYFGPTKE